MNGTIENPRISANRKRAREFMVERVWVTNDDGVLEPRDASTSLKLTSFVCVPRIQVYDSDPWASCSETIEVSSVVNSLSQSQHEGLSLLSMSNPQAGDVSNGLGPGFFDYLGKR